MMLDPVRPFYPLGALLLEQRTGKTIVAIGLAAYKYEVEKTIDAAIIVAMPSGVPANWADELLGNERLGVKRKLPDRIPVKVLIWRASDVKKASFQRDYEDLIKFKGLAVLAVNGEAVITETFRKEILKFFRARRALAIFDETSLLAKAPGNARTKVLLHFKKYCKERFILDGTPVGEGPFDLYSQFALLDYGILGHHTFQSFKAHHAEWETKTFFNKKKGVKEEYPAIKESEDGEKLYKNLDELNERVYKVSFRCTRKECFDIPDKVYQPYRFDLSKPQRSVYDSLAEEYEAELGDGHRVAVSQVLTRYLRLQQVASNFWPVERKLAPCPICPPDILPSVDCAVCDGTGAVPYETAGCVIDATRNPRLEALLDVLGRNPGQTLIWARFTHDVDAILAALSDAGRSALRYDGKITVEVKVETKLAFQRGRVQDLVCNQGAAQRGLDLSAAQAHIYYSNTYSGLQRQQTEDRTEVAGRTFGTGIIDLVANGTVDEDITLAHREKRTLGEIIMKKRSVFV